MAPVSKTLSYILFTIALSIASHTIHASSIYDKSWTDINGNTVNIDDYKGKWIVVNYWATWCPPCLEELPELEVFHDNHKDTDAVVIGINMEDIRIDRLKDFVADQFISFPIISVKPNPRGPFGPIPGMPTTYVLSPEGKVVAQQVGGITGALLENFIKRQIQKRQAAKVSSS